MQKKVLSAVGESKARSSVNRLFCNLWPNFCENLAKNTLMPWATFRRCPICTQEHVPRCRQIAKEQNTKSPNSDPKVAKDVDNIGDSDRFEKTPNCGQKRDSKK